MAAVMIEFNPAVFQAGGLLEHFAEQKHKAKWILQSGVESSPHIAHGAWFNGRDGYSQPPNSISISVMAESPCWFATPAAFNNLPLSEIRLQIANEIDRGILRVRNTGGSAVTSDDVRNGAVT